MSIHPFPCIYLNLPNWIATFVSCNSNLPCLKTIHNILWGPIARICGFDPHMSRYMLTKLAAVLSPLTFAFLTVTA